ncbi:MAG: FmdB family transcriptional regulator [Undibacterium sp.]|nr:FmdB family transcriptional regulator [Opitutaceae bacterium]
MPIYEYYCPNNHTVYQFYAKTLAQGTTVPKCPDNAKYRMQKMVSAFAVTSGGKKGDDASPPASVAAGDDGVDDARMEAAMGAMEKEFTNVDENDPRAMGRMMRRMAEMTGEKIDGEMEEVVRKLEEGADPDSLEERLDGSAGEGPDGDMGPGAEGAKAKEPREARARLKALRGPAARDPKLYDYE